MDSVQPAGDWKLDERPNTMIFYPTEINYNTQRQHAQPYVLVVQVPQAIQNIIKFTIRPLRIWSNLRGDEAWNPWWRTALLVQSPDTLPLPPLEASCGEMGLFKCLPHVACIHATCGRHLNKPNKLPLPS